MANGCTEVEIRETILHASIYAGMPAGMEGTRVAEKTLGELKEKGVEVKKGGDCLLYTSPSPRDGLLSRMPSSA